MKIRIWDPVQSHLQSYCVKQVNKFNCTILWFSIQPSENTQSTLVDSFRPVGIQLFACTVLHHTQKKIYLKTMSNWSKTDGYPIWGIPNSDLIPTFPRVHKLQSKHPLWVRDLPRQTTPSPLRHTCEMWTLVYVALDVPQLQRQQVKLNSLGIPTVSSCVYTSGHSSSAGHASCAN